MFKKALSLILVVAMLCTLGVSFASCGDGADELKGMSESPLAAPTLVKDFDVPENFKIGFRLGVQMICDSLVCDDSIFKDF